MGKTTTWQERKDRFSDESTILKNFILKVKNIDTYSFYTDTNIRI